MAIGSKLPPTDLASRAVTAQRTANTNTVGGTTQTNATGPTSWGATGAARIERPSADLTTQDLAGSLSTQTSSLQARWNLRPRNNGESQPDWEATVKSWADSRTAATADTPDVNRLCGTLTATVERLEALKQTNPKSPEIATLYQALADTVGPLTSGKDSFNVPDNIKARLFETMLPALDPKLLSGANLPPGFLFGKLGAPLFDGLSKVKPEAMGPAFLGAAATIAAEPNGDARKEFAKHFGGGVMRLYPDVPRRAGPEARFPPVGNSPVLMHLVGPQIARATFMQGAVPDELVKRDYGSGATKINWAQQLNELGKGGDHATRALGAMERFIAAQAPQPKTAAQ
jgi:hypothetical protein